MKIDHERFLAELTQSIKQDFIIKKRVLSFEEYMGLVAQNPRIHARNSAQYLMDCFNYFGMNGERFRLFDLEFEGGYERLIGQERAQQEIFRILSTYVRQGKVEHLILLHGPNGSSKSTLIACIAKALEYYSSTDEGALYKFNWVFPIEKVHKRGLGFGSGGESRTAPKSFAYLDESEIETKIYNEMKDHPLFLIPKQQRVEFLKKAINDADFILSEFIEKGDLSPICRQIFDALLSSYNGDLERVYQHVQVERFFLSRRFRRGLVTVEPQLQVDAGLRQITVNRSLESLPKILQNMTLFEAYGDLVDANRGMIEYNDLLKKPIESFKYLLATCEKSTVTLPTMILHLDQIFIGSSNERYLRAFIEHPDWPSFRGRIKLVRVPYLLDYIKESEIYESQVTSVQIGKHIAPHTMKVAGLFAVLTRLVPPKVGSAPERIKDALRRLAPIEKADLYAIQKAPDWASIKVATDLIAFTKTMIEDGQTQIPYEGEIGASPREIKAILYNVALSKNFHCLSPLSVIAGLEELLKDRSLYEFLRVEPSGEYMDHQKAIKAVQKRYLSWADDDVRLSMGLAAEGQYEELIARYVLHANQAVRGEKVRNPITGLLEDPDTHFLQEIENMLEIKRDANEFRKEVISKIGAWYLDNPDKAPPYAKLFDNLIEGLKTAFFRKHEATIRLLCKLTLSHLAGEKVEMTQAQAQRVNEIIENLKKRGYCERCGAEVVEMVLRMKYGG